MRLILVVLLVFLGPVSGAANLEWAGSVGNSGGNGEGWAVIRGTLGRQGGGVAVDRAGRIMTGGGDRVLALSRDGKLLWQTAMPQKGWILSGSRFAIAGKYLYFFAGNPIPRSGFMNLLWMPWTEVEPNLCRSEMYPGAKAQLVIPFGKLGWYSPWDTGQIGLGSDPTDGSLYVGAFTKSGYGIYRLQADGSLVKQLDSPGGAQFAIDEAGRWYFGGAGFKQVDKTGKQIPGTETVPLPSLGSVASAYSGQAMLTRDAVWDMGIYGFVGRFTKQFRADPGAVSQWNHALYFVAQIADAPDGAYYIKSNEALYVAQVVDGQLNLSRRFGSITRANGLCLLPDGYIGVGNDETNFHWFDFSNADPAAAPVRSESPGPSAQGYVDGNTFVAYSIGDYTGPLDYSPGSKSLATTSYHPEPFRDNANIAARVFTGSYPVSQIVALIRSGKWVYALDTKLNILLRADVTAPSNLTPLATQPTAQATITSLAAIGADTLLLGTDNGIFDCAVDASGDLSVRTNYQLPLDTGSFGNRVYVAASGNMVVAADSDRHRLVVLRGDDTLATLTFVAQFGETDVAGTDDRHLDTPTLVSMSNGRVVVYDSGNQRIVKLRVRE